MAAFPECIDEPVFWQTTTTAAMRGLVMGIFGYAERGAALNASIETASLTVPLIINFGSPFRIALGRRPEGRDAIASFVAGLFAGPVFMDSDGAAQCIQINFTPVGGRLFFGRPMSALAGEMVDLGDWGDREISSLANCLADLRSWPDRLSLAARFVEYRLQKSHPVDASVDWAFRAMHSCRGNIRIGKIAAELDWSRRKLVERFREEIGLPPKAIARIIRFNTAQSLALAATSPNWADIAAECGYADQAHLAREFADLAGSPPTGWRRAAA